VLDHDHRIALIDEFMQHFEELGDIVEMQTGGRLVEDIEGAARRPPGKLLGELDPLSLAAGQRIGLLPTLT